MSNTVHQMTHGKGFLSDGNCDNRSCPNSRESGLWKDHIIHSRVLGDGSVVRRQYCSLECLNAKYRVSRPAQQDYGRKEARERKYV